MSKVMSHDDEDSWASIEPLTVLQQQPVKKDSMFASPLPDSHRRGSSTEPSSHHRSADLPSPTGSSIRASKASSKSSPTIPSPVHSPQSNRHLTHTGMRSPSHELTPSSPRSREIEADNSAHNSDYHAATLPAQQKRHVHTGSSARENSDMYHSGSQSLSRRTSRQSNRSTRRSDRESVDTTSTKVQLPEAGKTRVVRLRREHPGEPIGITITVRTPSPPPGGSGNQATSNNLLGTDASLTLQRLMSGSLSNKQGGSGTPTKSDLSFRTEPVLAIQRIMSGSLADRQGGLFPGDILLEFNGRPVHSLDEVYSQMRQSASLLECEFLVQAPHSNGFLRPGQQHNFRSSKSKRYIRSFFDYDAKVDSLMPAGDVGLSFKAGDVLELVDDQDPNFWQVRPLNDAHGRVRLIPSQTLEERRQAFNQEKAQLTAEGTKKKSKRTIKTFFRAADASDLRVRSDLWSYEEVVPWPESMVPCLLLLGAPGVGRRNLKALLVNREPNRFDFPKSDTTDPDASPVNFNVIPKEQMEKDVRSGAYVEWGKADGHYYGIKFSALRKIIATGRTVVLDCQPQSVYLLHQPEFNPVTIFVAAPHFEVAKRMMEDGLRAGLTQNRRSDEELRAMVEESQSLAVKHRHLYFHKFTNSDMKEGVEKLSRLVTRVERHPSWIPSGWAYEMSAPTGSDTGTPFVPGSSTLSALGIHTLPPSRPSAIARSVLSGISEASAESASRLARPPSILSESVTSQQGRATPANGKRLYERRRRPQVEFRPTAPTIPELDTPSESMTNRSRASENQPASGRPMGFSGTPTSPKPRNSPQVSERSNGSLRRHQHGSQSEQTDGTQPNQGLKAMDNLRTSQLGEGKDRHSQSLRDSRNSSESSNHRFPRTQANNRQSGSSLAPRRYDTSTTVPADEDISDTSSEDEGEMKDKEVHL
ncbi:unnamed protein product [Calicophoron daubneyi]|uniref:Uncharacterized protein n=1 Tax=Calicophoron daubneyi TaxID=300641 RepID=A0AAV2TVZ1_CALDB